MKRMGLPMCACCYSMRGWKRETRRRERHEARRETRREKQGWRS